MIRESATLILNVPHKTKFPADFGTVLLKRSSKMKSIPDAYLFPGGALSKSDYDLNWSYHYSRIDIRRLTPSSAVCRPPLFLTPKDEPISRDLSLSWIFKLSFEYH